MTSSTRRSSTPRASCSRSSAWQASVSHASCRSSWPSSATAPQSSAAAVSPRRGNHVLPAAGGREGIGRSRRRRLAGAGGGEDRDAPRRPRRSRARRPPRGRARRAGGDRARSRCPRELLRRALAVRVDGASNAARRRLRRHPLGRRPFSSSSSISETGRAMRRCSSSAWRAPSSSTCGRTGRAGSSMRPPCCSSRSRTPRAPSSSTTSPAPTVSGRRRGRGSSPPPRETRCSPRRCSPSFSRAARHRMSSRCRRRSRRCSPHGSTCSTRTSER